MTVPTTTKCRHCTVPVDHGDVCTFCATYTPPVTVAQHIDVLVKKVDLIRVDGNKVLRELPSSAPLWSVVDLVAALNHLRLAAVLLDRATDRIEADTEAVQR